LTLVIVTTAGIKGPLKTVIELMGSEKNAAAVILHGFGGMGKTTLVHAGFARLFEAVILHGFGGMGKTTLVDAGFARLFDANIEVCRFLFVRLFDNIFFLLSCLTMFVEVKESGNN